MTELERCPFCGSTASEQFTMIGERFIQCDDPRCQAKGGKSGSFEGAAVLWNRRVQGSGVRGQDSGVRI